jgi:hypothetical protein
VLIYVWYLDNLRSFIPIRQPNARCIAIKTPPGAKFVSTPEGLFVRYECELGYVYMLDAKLAFMHGIKKIRGFKHVKNRDSVCNLQNV